MKPEKCKELKEHENDPKTPTQRPGIRHQRSLGYAVAMLTQAIVFPWFGFHATTAEHAGIALIFTVASLVRSYALRRLFNRFS